LNGQVAKRRSFAKMMNDAFQTVPGLRTTLPGKDIFHSYYKYYVFLKPEELRSDWDRLRVVNAITAEGIPCATGSCSEIYLEKAFDQIRPATRLANAMKLGDTSLMFMVHPTLTENDIRDKIAAVTKVMEHATAG
jgi:dTDP-4-amino-4,6-dideoxygalactose transaminase